MSDDPVTSTSAQFIAGEIQALHNDIRNLRVAPNVSSAEIRERLEPYTFAHEVPLTDSLRDVADMLRKWTLHATHPRYFGLFVPNTLEAGIWADALAALYNPQVGAWWHSDYLRNRLTSAGWNVVNSSPLPIVCFAHPALDSAESVAEIAQQVVSNGRAWISSAALPEGPVLRACITHDDTSRADIDILCEELERALSNSSYRK